MIIFNEFINQNEEGETCKILLNKS